MKRLLFIILIICFVLSSSCSLPTIGAALSTSTPTASIQPSETPANTPENTPENIVEDNAPTMAEDYAGPMIEAALTVLAASSRSDLSGETYPFESEYAYSGPTEDETSLYGTEGDLDKIATEDNAFLDAVCDLVVESIPEDASAYDKYRYLAYFLSLATEYDKKGSGGLMSITPYGAIIDGSSICLGYSTAYLYLCEKADLWCQCVYGYSDSGVHGWNLVKLEDGTYYVDVTWCDGLGEIGTADWMAYFMLTEDVLLLDHGIWNGGPATGTTIFN